MTKLRPGKFNRGAFFFKVDVQGESPLILHESCACAWKSSRRIAGLCVCVCDQRCERKFKKQSFLPLPGVMRGVRGGQAALAPFRLHSVSSRRVWVGALCVCPGRAVRENRRRVSERSWAGLARGDREGSGPDAGWDRLLLPPPVSPRCCLSLTLSLSHPTTETRGYGVKAAAITTTASGNAFKNKSIDWVAPVQFLPRKVFRSLKTKQTNKNIRVERKKIKQACLFLPALKSADFSFYAGRREMVQWFRAFEEGRCRHYLYFFIAWKNKVWW